MDTIFPYGGINADVNRLQRAWEFLWVHIATHESHWSVFEKKKPQLSGETSPKVLQAKKNFLATRPRKGHEGWLSKTCITLTTVHSEGPSISLHGCHDKRNLSCHSFKKFHVVRSGVKMLFCNTVCNSVRVLIAWQWLSSHYCDQNYFKEVW
jgi:hypothetical protein